MIVHRILVVDDDQCTLEATRRVLTPSGYVVSVAVGGRDAVNSLERGAVDLVITDLLMPDGDGLDLISNVRKNFANTRIVAMSGGGRLDADDYLLMARGFGVDAVLKKPFTSDELLTAIKTIESRSPFPRHP
jgi:DNA-binding response OmpR family regulator